MAGEYRLTAQGVSTRQAGSRMRRHLRRGSVLVGVAAAAVVVAACGSSSSGSGTSPGSGGAPSSTPSSAAAASGGISTRDLNGVGTILVNSSGMTIYTTKVMTLAPKCTGPCLGFWLPVTGTASTLSASTGLPGKLGMVHRSDLGKDQLTYNGELLYTFRYDTAAGQHNGNNYTDHFFGKSFLWTAVTASGQPAGTGGSPAPSPSSSSSSGGGYGY